MDWVDRVDGPHSWRECGEGEPIVFLHGLGGTRIAWGPQLRALGDRFRCIAWDMPGYGDAAPLEPLTFAGIAERLVGLLDTVGVERATLVGLSFGGMHALHTVIDHPERVARLVLADSSPAFGLDGTDRDEWIASRLGALDDGGTPADIAEAVVDGITHVDLEGTVRAETVGAFARIPTDGFRAAVTCLPTHDVRATLDQIDTPTLVVVGEHDDETPLSYSQMLADGIVGSELRVIPGAGHLTPAEVPDEFNTALTDFLTHTPGSET